MRTRRRGVGGNRRASLHKRLAGTVQAQRSGGPRARGVLHPLRALPGLTGPHCAASRHHSVRIFQCGPHLGT